MTPKERQDKLLNMTISQLTEYRRKLYIMKNYADKTSVHSYGELIEVVTAVSKLIIHRKNMAHAD